MSVLFAQYLHLVIIIFDTGHRLSVSITLMLFFVAFITPGVSFFLLFKRQQDLQGKLLVDSLNAIKSEADIEKAVAIFVNQIERATERSLKGAQATNFGISNIPFAQSMFNSSETHLSKEVAGLILYHREKCMLYTHGQCFCRQFDDSLTANRLILDE